MTLMVLTGIIKASKHMIGNTKSDPIGPTNAQMCSAVTYPAWAINKNNNG